MSFENRQYKQVYSVHTRIQIKYTADDDAAAIFIIYWSRGRKLRLTEESQFRRRKFVYTGEKIILRAATRTVGIVSIKIRTRNSRTQYKI